MFYLFSWFFSCSPHTPANQKQAFSKLRKSSRSQCNISIQCPRTGVLNLQPMGQIWPMEVSHLARKALEIWSGNLVAGERWPLIWSLFLLPNSRTPSPTNWGWARLWPLPLWAGPCTPPPLASGLGPDHISFSLMGPEWDGPGHLSLSPSPHPHGAWIGWAVPPSLPFGLGHAPFPCGAGLGPGHPRPFPLHGTKPSSFPLQVHIGTSLPTAPFHAARWCLPSLPRCLIRNIS